MPPRNRMFFAVLMLVLLAIPGVALLTELSRRSDIWWTPPTMLVPINEGADRVVVNVRGKPLARADALCADRQRQTCVRRELNLTARFG